MSRSITVRRAMPVAIAFLATALTACTPPAPPDEERRPQPQAQSAQPKSGIVQTADAYKDHARSAETQQQEAADRQRAQLDAATQ